MNKLLCKLGLHKWLILIEYNYEEEEYIDTGKHMCGRCKKLKG